MAAQKRKAPSPMGSRAASSTGATADMTCRPTVHASRKRSTCAEGAADSAQGRGRNCGEHGVTALHERVLTLFHRLQDVGGEVGRQRRIFQRSQALHQGAVHRQLGRALVASVDVLARLEPLGSAQRPVGQALDLLLGEMDGGAHERCSASLDLSSLRARCSQVMTVPIGTFSASAISA